MYIFGIAVLAGLGVMCVAHWFRPLVALADRVMGSATYPILEVALGVGFAWAVKLDLWQLWAIPVRAEWVAITFTGVAIGGIAHFFTAILDMFEGLGRKLHDEAKTIEEPTELRRVA